MWNYNHTSIKRGGLLSNDRTVVNWPDGGFEGRVGGVRGEIGSTLHFGLSTIHDAEVSFARSDNCQILNIEFTV